jgi:hypothetical protein
MRKSLIILLAVALVVAAHLLDFAGLIRQLHGG